MDFKTMLPTESLTPVLRRMAVNEIIEVPQSQVGYPSVRTIVAEMRKEMSADFKLMKANASTIIVRTE